jgi:hypothetical protein
LAFPRPPAVIGIVTYLLGLIRPVAIDSATYWITGSGPSLNCVVRNRKMIGDRTLRLLALINLPRLRYRLWHRGWWKSIKEDEPFYLTGEDIGTIRDGHFVLARRNPQPLTFQIVSPDGVPLLPSEALAGGIRLLAQIGESRPAISKLKRVDIG